MYRARDIANYFLQLDKSGEMFNATDLMEANSRRFWTGNARLNKYLHLAQNIYFAKNGRHLFKDNLYAYDNGGVVTDVQENYTMLIAKRNEASCDCISEEDRVFLKKLSMILSDATIEELMRLSHEDPAWEEKHLFYQKKDQIMDIDSKLEEYRIQYEDVIQLMDRMDCEL